MWKKWSWSCHFKIETNYTVALLQLGKIHDILWQDTSADVIWVAAAVGFNFRSTLTSIMHLSRRVRFGLTLKTRNLAFPLCRRRDVVGRSKDVDDCDNSARSRLAPRHGLNHSLPSLQTTARLQQKARRSWFAFCNTSKVQNCKKKWFRCKPHIANEPVQEMMISSLSNKVFSPTRHHPSLVFCPSRKSREKNKTKPNDNNKNNTRTKQSFQCDPEIDLKPEPPCWCDASFLL